MSHPIIDKNALVPGLEVCPYVTHRHHQYLAEDAWRDEGPNIGMNGEHLTITFLSLNRTVLAERLCRSIAKHIPEFRGEILVIDNGSSKEERSNLLRFLQEMPFRWKIKELGQNFGVSGGRNRTMPFVSTEWVMSLDNDVFFVKNPLPQIQQDLAQLGCHFMTLAVLNEDAHTNFIRGGHLYLSYTLEDFIIGGGSVFRPDYLGEERRGYLCTFMSGCASVFRKDTFLSLGGFDERMFVGFEDFEFSLRLFRAGYKVGASDTRALVHDHPKPSNSDDLNYEKKRFARAHLIEAAAHFEKKHGYRVWTQGVDLWVAQRERELGLATSCSDHPQAAPPSQKQKISLIVDRFDWALANIARQIVAHLSDEFEFEILSSQIDKPELLLFMTKQHALTHFLWREPLHLIGQEWRRWSIDLLFGNWDSFCRECIAPRPLTFSVYDHLFLNEDDIRQRQKLFNEYSSGYTVSSKKLELIYKGIEQYPKPSAVTPDGVDLDAFQPCRIERLDEIGSRPLRVGWVGNSAWGIDQMEDPKGYHSILCPALEHLRAQGYAIETQFADMQKRIIPHHRMPEYYQTVDVIVCSSMCEGTPNPVLEAMACGIPVISTDVGVVSEAFGPLQSRFILPERSIPALVTALKILLDQPALAKQLSEENLHYIKPWDWSVRSEAFRHFFKSALAHFSGSRQTPPIHGAD